MGLNLKIGTRSSQLAIVQAEWVRERLLALEEVDSVELVKIKTSGDKLLDVPLAKVGGKGLFTKEIEESLLRVETDLAVHSMKDVPVDIPSGLKLEVIPEREDPRDALVSNGVGFIDLPSGALIGTSSLRRMAQLTQFRSDLQIIGIRGNLQTRLQKLETENLNGLILAAAGLKRIGETSRITDYLPEAIMLPAVGQGALGIETRDKDPRVEDIVRKLHHQPTAYCVMGERAFLKRLQGGCQVPMAALGKLDGDILTIDGLVSDLDGDWVLRDRVTGPASDCERIGKELAEKLLERGADEILDEIYGNKV